MIFARLNSPKLSSIEERQWLRKGTKGRVSSLLKEKAQKAMGG
jgi:hypothetical protein